MVAPDSGVDADLYNGGTPDTVYAASADLNEDGRVVLVISSPVLVSADVDKFLVQSS
jgi:hypothetical protein